MNNKGFTLVELIAVLAVMITILLIAIPSISSSIERNKGSFDKQNRKVIFAASEVYADMYLNKEAEKQFKSDNCGILIKSLIEKKLIDEETAIKNDGTTLKEKCVWNSINVYSIEECNDDDRCD